MAVRTGELKKEQEYSFRRFQFDADTVALITIDYPHHEVHEGSAFTAAGLLSAHASELANDGTVLAAFQVGALPAHIVWSVKCGGDFEYTIYEGGSAVTTTGTVTPINMNRNSTATAGGTLFKISAGASGTALWTDFVPGGSGPLSPGGQSNRGLEWILAANTFYYMEIINRSGAGQMVGIEAEWYEKATNAT
jgi:hypothetical protein